MQTTSSFMDDAGRLAGKWARTVGLCFLCLVTSAAGFAVTDGDTRQQANELISRIEVGIAELKAGDVGAYNTLSTQINESGALLKGLIETSEQADVGPLVARWQAAREALVAIAQSWQAAGATAVTPVSAQNPDSLLEAYRRENRQPPGDGASIAQWGAWLDKIQMLQTTRLQQDAQRLRTWTAQGQVSDADADRIWRWIGGQFQEQIRDDLVAQSDRVEGAVREALILSELLAGIEPSNEIRAHNFTSGDNGQRNQRVLADGLEAMELGARFDALLQREGRDRSAERQTLARAQAHFAKLTEAGQRGAATLAAAPKAKPKKRPEFLTAVTQKYWLRGSVIGEVDNKGRVWIDSRKVGDIENDGRIWVGGINKGSLEPDGKLWFQGRHIGTLTDAGEVWRGSRHVGTVDDEGKVWFGGSATGSIEGFNGQWKRAAVVMFFDVFREG